MPPHTPKKQSGNDVLLSFIQTWRRREGVRRARWRRARRRRRGRRRGKNNVLAAVRKL